MKLLDSTFLIDLLRGNKSAFKIMAQNESFATTQINMYEVMRVLFLQKVTASKTQEVISLFDNITVLQLNNNSIIKSSEISAELVKAGKMLPDADCLIAGIALSHNVKAIVTKNVENFKMIKGLRVESY